MLNNSENKSTITNTTPIPSGMKKVQKKNRIPMLLGLSLVILVALAGVGISLRQFFVRDTVAPTAPEESQASIDKVEDCSLSFDVAPPEPGISCIKRAYQDELSNTAGEYELLEMQGTFTPGEVIVYSFLVTNTGEVATTITATDSIETNIADDASFTYEFLDSNCGSNAFSEGTITCTTGELDPGQSETFVFRIQLGEDIDKDMTLSNMVAITDGEINRECSVDVTIDSPTEAYCNDTCETNNDCVESNHFCSEGVCRLIDNPESESCTEALCNGTCSANVDCVEDNHFCNGGVCRLIDNPDSVTCEEIEPSPTPETQAYCNESCENNNDCVESDHICYNDVCRLESNPSSTNCQPASQNPSPTPETQAYCGEYCSSNADCVESDHICYFNACRLAEYPDRQDCSVPTQTVTTTYVAPTPTVGCNQDCISNRDCANSDHICYEGNCRLAEYPASSTCTIPQAQTTVVQPKMPEELPQSGSDDLINWIKAGIGILGAGALLLLL